jgi:hypothetical protein
MQFLKTLFWVALAVAAVIFSFNNWEVAQVRLWNGLILDAKLPVLLLLAFLLGFLPPYILLQTSRWRLKRRLDATERALADLRAVELPPVPAPLDPVAADPTARPASAFVPPVIS